MNPHLANFLESLTGLIVGTAIVAIPHSIWKKKKSTKTNQQHQPKVTNTEKDFQRWKTERKKQEP